jgi:hypothetical protein
MGKKLKANKAQGSKLKAKGREGLRPLEVRGFRSEAEFEWGKRKGKVY